MRWAERGISPVRAAVIGFVLLGIASYFIFTKQLPWAQHRMIYVVVHNSNLLAPGSPVRIGGVDVGKVTATARYRHTSDAVVSMEIDNTSQVIHKDATIDIRPRLFLEGNFYVQLSPGTPSSAALGDGGTIPIQNTTDPVQIDQLFDTLSSPVRRQLQVLLKGFGTALDTTPTAAENSTLDPSVQGLTGAQAINRTFDTSAASLRDSAIVSEALNGPDGKALSKMVAGFAKASTGLTQAQAQLGPLIVNFDQTMRAMAAQQQGLRQTVRLLGPAAQHANTAFAALDSAFPPTERFSNAFASSLPELPATIDAAYPWLAQAKPLLSSAELGGLLHDLQPASADLAKLTNNQRQFMPAIDAFNQCMTKVFIPTGNVVVKDGALSSGVPNYREFFYAMVGQAAEGQGSDGNGNFLRINAAGGPFSVESGQTNYNGNTDTGFAQMAAKPLGTRPFYPNQVPPLQRKVACDTQRVPDVNGAASTGPADGSRPNAPRPSLPNDPTRNLG